MRGLYAIADVDLLSARGIDPVAFAGAVLEARPAALQLRDKSGGARRTLGLLRAIAPLARRAAVPLFANDRPDLALLAGCDGVHVGQDDVPVSLVREIAPRLRVGLSTHAPLEVRAAIADNPDYIAVGPVFPTASKERPSPVLGLEALRALAATIRSARPSIPIVAIGGISLATAPGIGAVCDCAAVIGALIGDGDRPDLEGVRGRAAALQAALTGASA